MKTATVADLRNNFRRVSHWIEDGETVQILKRGQPFAQLSAIPTAAHRPKAPKPNIMAQLRRTWGNRVFSAAEVEAMRAAELAGED